MTQQTLDELKTCQKWDEETNQKRKQKYEEIKQALQQGKTLRGDDDFFYNVKTGLNQGLADILNKLPVKDALLLTRKLYEGEKLFASFFLSSTIRSLYKNNEYPLSNEAINILRQFKPTSNAIQKYVNIRDYGVEE